MVCTLIGKQGCRKCSLIPHATLCSYVAHTPAYLPSLISCCCTAVQYIRCPISTLCIGQAASMASLLLTAGEQGQRRCLPHARIMLHQPLGAAEVGARDPSAM